MPKVASAVVLSEADRNQLESWVRAQFTPQQVALRSRILLMAAAGKQDLEIADELDVNRHTPALWRKRFQTQGLDGVWEIQPGRGRKPSYDEEKMAAIVTATLQTKPKGSTHWSCRTMARAQQVSPSTINRLWQEYNLKPHRTRSFKLSRDIRFLEKLTDVVGLYLNPPDRSLVLCIDEKLDNYGTHKHPKVRSWLERHPRFALHFIPTSSSWLNQVERWFGELTQKAVRRGAFISVAELQQTIGQFLQAWNEAPRPFVWTATVENIMAKIERARQRLEDIKPGWSKRKRRKKRQ